MKAPRSLSCGRELARKMWTYWSEIDAGEGRVARGKAFRMARAMKYTSGRPLKRPPTRGEPRARDAMSIEEAGRKRSSKRPAPQCPADAGRWAIPKPCCVVGRPRADLQRQGQNI